MPTLIFFFLTDIQYCYSSLVQCPYFK
jgi:hypothetical protein